MLWSGRELRGLFEHKAYQCVDIQVCEEAGIAFVVFDEAAARNRGEGALNHPPERQQDRAALRLRQFADLESDVVCASRLGWRLALGADSRSEPQEDNADLRRGQGVAVANR